MVTSWISEWHILFWVTLTLTLTSSLNSRNTVPEALFLYYLGGGGGSEYQSCYLNTSWCRRASHTVSRALAFLYFMLDRNSIFGLWIHFGTVEYYILLQGHCAIDFCPQF